MLHTLHCVGVKLYLINIDVREVGAGMGTLETLAGSVTQGVGSCHYCISNTPHQYHHQYHHQHHQ